MRIRIGLVDDHPVVIGGLEAALATATDVEVVAIGRTVVEARELLRRDDLDVVLLDVRLEDGNGLQVLTERHDRQRPAVLVVSTFSSSQYVAAASRFGAAGFIAKTADLPTLLEAIRVVAAGGTVFTSDQLRAGFVTLTSREREILRLAMDGLSNKEIAARLGTAAKTVEGHLSAIFERHEIAGGRIELTMRAAKEGWLEIDPPRRATTETARSARNPSLPGGIDPRARCQTPPSSTDKRQRR